MSESFEVPGQKKKASICPAVYENTRMQGIDRRRQVHQLDSISKGYMMS
jgi:hypothetical protein